LLICYLGNEVSFIGVHPRVKLDGKLDKKSFRSIKGGKTIEIMFDTATVYDLSEGGKYDVTAEGFLPFAGKNKIDGEAAYKSNSISIEVNGTEAAEVKERSLRLNKRNTLDGDCTAGRLEATTNALAVCSQLATLAAIKARSGDANQ
jgi:deuterolysin